MQSKYLKEKSYRFHNNNSIKLPFGLLEVKLLFCLAHVNDTTHLFKMSDKNGTCINFNFIILIIINLLFVYSTKTGINWLTVFYEI